MLRKQDSTPQMETFGSSIKSDEINASVGVFAATISASDKEKEIVNRVQVIGDEFLKLMGDSIYQFALKFDLQKEKLKLKELLASDLMKEHLKFWEVNTCIHYDHDEDEHNLPSNKVCIKLKYDQENFPEYFKIAFKSKFNSLQYEWDLIDNIPKQVKYFKENKFTFLDKISELHKEVESISDQLNLMSNQDRNSTISKFNKKWYGQISMTYIINSHYRTGLYKVEDKNRRVLFHGAPHAIKIDSAINDASHHNILFIDNHLSSPTKNSGSKEIKGNQLPSIAHTQMSFWKRNLSTTVATALAVGVGVSAVLYSMSK